MLAVPASGAGHAMSLVRGSGEAGDVELAVLAGGQWGLLLLECVCAAQKYRLHALRVDCRVCGHCDGRGLGLGVYAHGGAQGEEKSSQFYHRFARNLRCNCYFQHRGVGVGECGGGWNLVDVSGGVYNSDGELNDVCCIH